MHKHGEFTVAFDELVPENQFVMRKATYEKLVGAKVVDASLPVRRVPDVNAVRRHPSAATAAGTILTADPENPATELGEDDEQPI